MNVIDSNSTANVQSVPGSSRSPTYHNVTPVTATNISPKSNLQKFIAGDPKALGFITSGALTVAAGNYRHFCIVNTSMAFNIVSSVIAVISIILYSINFALHGHFSRYSSILNSQVFLAVFLLIFALLEFSICIAVSIYSCKATCSCTDSYAQMPVVVVQYNANPETHTVPPVP
ncbi:membrane-spanning 4-domains subfamily A member 12-like isoform X2 [Protopterus annectens]|uniref:membrane-spanning 4-domains subfamily A member 12-like isoform X2 n=1 Tax=Protopterus annectens TaxID=7888 RepID=UPI001CF9FC4C|nr:membrane-spanning 4-domains subfamily A member 12-like isoform X2 [Protopterus annectens]